MKKTSIHLPIARFLSLSAVTAAMILVGATGSLAEQYRAEQHYQILDTPVRTSDPARIEVAEIFWYGCSHCYSFEPTITAWLKTLPKDVVFVRTPAIWHPTMELHARAFYTAKVLGVLEQLHPVIFRAMNVGKNKLANEDAIAELFVANGVAEQKFRKTFNSFGVTSAVKQAAARQRSYQIQGTPEVVVNGKYRITARMGGGHAGMMNIVDFLINKDRELLPATAATP